MTILGEVPAGQAITRGGARLGDDVYVSGVLGDAALALAAMRGAHRRSMPTRSPRAACGSSVRRRGSRWAQRLRGVATAMLDVSDGLTGDLGHILERPASAPWSIWPRCRVRRCWRSMLPGAERALARQCLLAGGDDYELCFTARAGGIGADRAHRRATFGCR